MLPKNPSATDKFLVSASLGPAFDHGVESMMAINPRGDRILDANAAACTLLGYERQALQGMAFSALHAGQIPALIVFSQAVMDRGRYHTRSLSPRRRDGVPLKVEYGGVLIPGEPDPLLLITLTDLNDIRQRAEDVAAEEFMRSGVSEWQRVERLFRDIESENQLILRAAGEGIYGVNGEGKTTFVNPAAERLLGWTAQELVGKEMHAAVHHSHADGSHYPDKQCPIYAAFRDGAVHQVDNEVFWRKDGTPLWVAYTSTPIRDRGILVGAVIVFRDVTQRREADEKLRAALAEVDSLRARLELENAYLQEEIRIQNNHRGVIGQSAAIQRVLQQVDLVAPTDATVLIHGEAGSGKELIARSVHEASRRSHRPLIRVNTTATPQDALEGELFGHIKGAFAGATRDRTGRVELADGGTVFINEVCDLSLSLQGKLLRVLQEGQIERLGDDQARTVNVRVIAATSFDLRQEVKAGRLREDLYFALNVFPIEMAPLRERRDDIAPLAAHILRGVRNRLKMSNLRLSEGDVRRLARYDWPGNVRELQNVIERAAILSRRGRLRIDLPESSLPARATGKNNGVSQASIMTDSARRTRDRENIKTALAACGGRVFGERGAAQLLGVKPTTLISRMKSLGIEAPRATARA